MIRWQQFKALIWLRWRLIASQFRKTGLGVRIVLGLFVGGLVFGVIGGSVIAFCLAYFLIDADQPHGCLLAWDLLAGIFLISWFTGFISELQRDEPLSVERMMQFPLSPRGAFGLNYISSFASFTVLIITPIAVAVSIATALVFGSRTLVSIPLFAAGMVLVTAVTFQFRGWLAALMATPRKRRTVQTVIFLVFFGSFQLPNLIGTWSRNRTPRETPAIQQLKVELTAIDHDLRFLDSDLELPAGQLAQQLLPTELNREEAEQLLQQRREIQQRLQQEQEAVEIQQQQAIIGGHRFIPPGWIGYGVYSAAKHQRWLPALLATAGMLAIAYFSLSRSYRGTLNYYRRVAKVPRRKSTVRRQRTYNAIDRRISWPSLHVSTVAASSLVNLWRSPMLKMQLLAPFVLLLVLAAPMHKMRDSMDVHFRPLLALALIGITIFLTFSISLNVFGHDRHGFRSFMLMPIRQRDILIGKNLSISPIVVLLWMIGCTGLMVLCPLRWYDLLAACCLMAASYLVCCIPGNFVSILWPYPVAGSTMRKAAPRWQAIIAQMVAFLAVSALIVPVGLPLILATLQKHLGIWPMIPVSLPLSILVLITAIAAYWVALRPTSRLLWTHQRSILLEVTRSPS